MEKTMRRYYRHSRRGGVVRRFFRRHRLGVQYVLIATGFTLGAYAAAKMLFG